MTQGLQQTRSFGYARYSSSPSKTLRRAVGRSICPAGCADRAQEQRLETARPQLAAHRKSQGKTRQVESAGADMSPRIGGAPEAVMSDQDDWEFSDADDAKAEIRAAVGYLLRDATGGARGDIVQAIISIVRQVASGLAPEQPNSLDDGLPGG
jgi:hypothetical protein